MPMTQKEMVNLLRKHGWVELSGKRGKGSHKMMCKHNKRSITIPHGELNKYTQQAILKEAGLR